jgi:uncharacterized membrane protein YdbT with pleckstrin-like domain
MADRSPQASGERPNLRLVDPEPGEEIFFHGHPSWRALFAFYGKGLALSILAGALAGVITAIAAGHVEVGWVIAAVLVVFVVGLAVAQITRLQTTYSITNQRLTIQTGLLSREMHETRLERVQNVNLRQSLPERLLRIGTVDFDTAAGAEYDFSFRGVGEPRRIVRTVDRALHSLRDADPGVPENV